MPIPKMLLIKLLSDTTVGRGEGTAGAVDVEVEHDDDGLPCINGKTLHGLLRDSWLSMADSFPVSLHAAALSVFGPAGDLAETSGLRIGDAVLEQATRDWVRHAVKRRDHPLHPATILEAFTDIRCQTSENRATGAPEATTLRQTRVVLRGLEFHAPLAWLREANGDMQRCLALSALGVRHIGLARNRGRGHVLLSLDGDPLLTQRLAKGGL